MAVTRKHAVPNSSLLVAIGIVVVATASLIAFPGNLLAWQVAAWSLAVALAALLPLALLSGYSLIANPATRTWQRIATTALGFACLAVVAIGWI